MTMLGSTILRFDSVASTNDVARDMAAFGAPEGTCVAGSRANGGSRTPGPYLGFASRGRPLSLGYFASDYPSRRVACADSCGGVAVAETLKLDFEVTADIKWPNDVMASGRKICGILVESAIERDRLQYAVMGIGLNVAQREFPDEISAVATSLLIETGRSLAPDDVLNPLLERLTRWYEIAVTEPSTVLARWEELSSYARGCAVRVESSDWSIEGVTRGLASTGALRVELANGEIREVFSGEVSLRARTVSG